MQYYIANYVNKMTIEEELMLKLLHPVAGSLAIVMILTFWISTALSELFASTAVVTVVKTAIPWGFLVLIPAMIGVGISGFRLAKGRGGAMIARKRKRMPVIAANGLLILAPAALFLADKAGAGAFDTAFYTVQAVELVAGAVNICLLGLNMRDGLRLRQRRRASV
jgi:hypothetical protein|tara:strand:+ start:10520 stop:11017 length:498 start_codon:yes stop_codon:yes gene_type:complete